MEDISLLKDIVTILGVSLVIIIVFQRIKIPPIIGFLISGMVVGPYGFNWISDSTHEVEILSETGIIFLLFVIGIEFSLKELIAIKKKVFMGGGLQVAGTILLTTLIAWLFKIELNKAVFIGFLVTLSSTAIILQLLQEKGDVKTQHGRMAVGILIFQDIIVVPMMLIIPILTGKIDNIGATLGWMGVKLVGLLIFIYLLARFIVPVVFRLVIKTKKQELFLLTVLTICFATAMLTASIGLSLALGAFFAGLIISESDYSHHATANVMPFREIFVSFFFVSVGILLDIHFFIEHIGWVLLLTLGVILIKMLILAATVKLMKLPFRTLIFTMLSLFQVGEFSLLLSGEGLKEGLLTSSQYQYFLAVAILSMAVTPFIMTAAPKLLELIAKRKINREKYIQESDEVNEDLLHEHLVIIGYGLNGENIAKAAKNAEIPYTIVELNPEAFKKAKAHKQPVVFGNATNELILKHVHIQEARVIVIAISDPEATKHIVKSIREFTKTAYIIVRTRYVKEIEENIRIGADEVIPEEFETSIQIFTRVMNKYMIPKDDIQTYINYLRSSDYQILTNENADIPFPKAIQIPKKSITTLRVEQGSNSVVGKSVFESQIRKNYGVTVLAIRRESEYITELTADTIIKEGDILYLFGSNDEIHQLNKKLGFEV